jgi:hypothetical protein
MFDDDPSLARRGKKNCREDFSGKKTQRRENVLIHFRCNGDYLGL